MLKSFGAPKLDAPYSHLPRMETNTRTAHMVFFWGFLKKRKNKLAGRFDLLNANHPEPTRRAWGGPIAYSL